MTHVWNILGLSAVALVAMVVYFAWTRSALEKMFRSIPNFRATTREVVNGSIFAVDQERRLLAIVTPSMWRTTSFDLITHVEPYQGTQSTIKTNRGSQIAGAAVGGALLGPTGLLIGGVTGSKRIENSVQRLSLFVHINDFNTPVLELNFYRGVRGGPTQHQVMQFHRWNLILQTAIASRYNLHMKALEPAPKATTTEASIGDVSERP